MLDWSFEELVSWRFNVSVFHFSFHWYEVFVSCFFVFGKSHLFFLVG